jgi:hypothetical protein
MRLQDDQNAEEAQVRRVIVESPFAGDIEANVIYARAAVRDCVLRGEAPIASHLLFTQPGILDDNVPEERALGIEAGLAWGFCRRCNRCLHRQGHFSRHVYGHCPS